MTSANKKGALLFIGGLVLGGLITNNHWSSQENVQQQAVGAVEAQLADTRSKLASAELALAEMTVLREQQVADMAVLTTAIESKDAQIAELSSNLASQRSTLNTTKAALEAEVTEKSASIARLKQRVQDTDFLYAERYRLTKQVNDLREQILKDSHKMALSLTACEEYKKGNSWNRVSQSDCDLFTEIKSKNDVSMAAFDDVSADLDRIKRALSAFDARIDNTAP